LLAADTNTDTTVSVESRQVLRLWAMFCLVSKATGMSASLVKVLVLGSTLWKLEEQQFGSAFWQVETL